MSARYAAHGVDTESEANSYCPFLNDGPRTHEARAELRKVGVGCGAPLHGGALPHELLIRA
eukprot:7616898-Pyramimonas_sp.AAC.1